MPSSTIIVKIVFNNRILIIHLKEGRTCHIFISLSHPLLRWELNWPSFLLQEESLCSLGSCILIDACLILWKLSYILLNVQVDLDLGNYEQFLNVPLTCGNNITTKWLIKKRVSLIVMSLQVILCPCRLGFHFFDFSLHLCSFPVIYFTLQTNIDGLLIYVFFFIRVQ